MWFSWQVHALDEPGAPFLPAVAVPALPVSSLARLRTPVQILLYGCPRHWHLLNCHLQLQGRGGTLSKSHCPDHLCFSGLSLIQKGQVWGASDTIREVCLELAALWEPAWTLVASPVVLPMFEC